MEILLNLLKFACLVPLHVPTIYSTEVTCFIFLTQYGILISVGHVVQFY